ncbi:GNAT family N-acetyltransferase [Thermaerobacillus caldiproteolyticus]|uniref:GNAT family N-acetyltransferase n=1 Tax=Thermaerobacillus caldiproteolyticus TaxID=247480 RepID=UPI001889F5F2|nr:GNAT family N-acetyltransferase [Anoxybacillus caldiproteolyticus]QPA32157.1 GNAT family N-acetyltransferase [Anoxybacillus caldiproteolyticus]
MYITRWATKSELPLLAEYWFKMACEMGEKDGIPIPNIERVHEVRNLFIKESEENNLGFRVAIDENGNIVACAGGLIRMEYATPLSEEQTLFGWVICVYTINNHRKKGLASQLVEEVCSWLKERGAKRARLWASSQGRRIYESIGFSPMLDMEKVL